MGIASFIKNKRQDRFLELLIEQGRLTLEGLQFLETIITEPTRENADAMNRREYEADEVKRILTDELHRTFITPIDREDIFNISEHIDEMLDYAQTTIEAMILLGVDADEFLQKMVAVNRTAAEELHFALQRLNGNPRVAQEHAWRVRKSEEEVKRIYRQAVADLFTKVKDFKRLMGMMKRREVYRHVSNMADRARAAATVIGIVVMKLS
jgi:predicted phosphate transport protein (TIGR00153 family)